MDKSINNEENRPVSGFSGLQFKAVGKVILSQGDQESLIIHADPEIRARITTEVKDGVLVISYDLDWRDWTGLNFIDKGSITFNLTMKDISSLTISGVGHLDAATITTSSLALKLAGPGSITVGTLQVNSLSVEMSGVCSIDVAGKCTDQTVTLSGAGSYKAPRLESAHAAVKLSGVGNATVWANETLDANLSGVGAVEYYGNCKISQKVSGVGVLKYLGNR
jgi:hypothetical protein